MKPGAASFFHDFTRLKPVSAELATAKIVPVIPEAEGADTPPLLKRHTIQPTSGWRLLDLPQLWAFRDLLSTLAVRDLRLRYRQTALGVIWVILQPLLAAGIFSFVFGTVLKAPSDGVPYFIFSYAGMVAWTLFHNTLSRSSACLVGNAHLVSKVFFPRLILPLSTVYATLVDFAVALGMMGVLMAIYGVAPGPGLLLLPVCAAMILAFSLGLGLLAAGLMVSYRDVQFILPVALQFLLYATPVGYPVSAVPEAWRSLYLLNPLSVLIETFRTSLIGSGQIAWGPFLAASLFACALLTVGAFAFRRMERRFADII